MANTTERPNLSLVQKDCSFSAPIPETQVARSIEYSQRLDDLWGAYVTAQNVVHEYERTRQKPPNSLGIQIGQVAHEIRTIIQGASALLDSECDGIVQRMVTRKTEQRKLAKKVEVQRRKSYELKQPKIISLPRVRQAQTDEQALALEVETMHVTQAEFHKETTQLPPDYKVLFEQVERLYDKFGDVPEV